MRRLIKFLSPLIFTMLFMSCVQSVEQDGLITFDAGQIVSRAVQYSNNKSRNIRGEEDELSQEEIEAIRNALEFTANLSLSISSSARNYQKTIEKQYDVVFFDNQNFIDEPLSFNDVPAGAKAIIKGTVTSQITIKDKEALLELAGAFEKPVEDFEEFDEDQFAEFFAEQFGFKFAGQTEVFVKSGTNDVTLNMKWQNPNSGSGGSGSEDETGIDVNGTIVPQLPQKLRIEMAESNEQLLLNKGTITFKLLDEADNDLVAEYGAIGSANWKYELRY